MDFLGTFFTDWIWILALPLVVLGGAPLVRFQILLQSIVDTLNFLFGWDISLPGSSL